MTVHQVITGALNNGEHSFSIGCVDGVNFIACAVGTDIAILAPNFDRVQIIPGNESENGDIASSVSCCIDTGKIAAVYGNKVRIFEPSYCFGVHEIVPYQWNEVHKINDDKPITTVQWVLEGLRLLLMCNSELILYQHQSLSTAVRENTSNVTFSINEERISSAWDILWRTSLPFENKYVKFSPDGSLFATCGENDHLVKIWYQQDESFTGNNAKFHFTYLQHPAPVIGFEWRRTSRYMPRKCVQNAIITWCEDNTSRIWKQTPKNEIQLEALIEAVDVVSKNTEKTRKSFKIKKARRKLVLKISQLLQKDIGRSGTTSQTSSLTRSATFADFIVPAATTNSLHFCLVATIDAANDCFLVPSLKTKANVPCQPFVIHWLNNKELMFAFGAEKILTDTILHESFDSTTRTPKTKSTSSNLLSEENVSELAEDNLANGVVDTSKTSNSDRLPSVPLSTSNTIPEISFKDMLEAKLEGLLKEWNKCVDVVFSVYPVDGSLLTWTIEWLDDTWRQPTINFASRFPNAFPITDATSLNLSLYTFNPHNPIYAEVAQKHSPEPIDSDAMEHVVNKCQDDIPKDTIHLLTSHVNGSLNLWDLTTEEGCAFTHILNIVHKSRMCGHRFHISKVIAHPVLPLLLTASHSTRRDRRSHESELILWKVSPVSPLCKSGGVRELSRLNSMFPLAFDCLSWVPAILPSSTLGTVCNSPSSCFIASNNGRLCVYQAVVDARGLLAELYSSKNAPERSIQSSTSSLVNDAVVEEPAKLSDTFNVVSTQSTAKPGCVLFLEDVENSSHTTNEMLMLHVFNEELAINNKDANLDHPEQQNSLVIDRSKSSAFSDNYFIVMVVKMENEDRIRMWSLNVSAQSPVPIKNYVDDGETKTETTNSDNFYPTATITPPSAAKLAISSKLIYDEAIDLPSGVRIVSCVVAAGHLPSASLYPACRAPYLLTVSCSDDHIRFIRCCSKMMYDGTTGYEWNFWKMISDDIRSDLELDGEIYAVSCAHSGRFASAYRSCDSNLLKNRLNLTEDLRVAVFECESSGGVEWLQEDSFDLEKYVIQTAGTKNLIASFDRTDDDYDATDPKITLTERIRRFVRIDWVSAEDGSHILTVGIGHTIYLFAQVSRDIAQQNIVMMKETEPHLRNRLRKASSLVSAIHCTNKFVRWMCIRALELQSADGLPPLPTAMSWVRDGMLIIGLHSEMRIYNQWNPKGKFDYSVKKNLPKSQNESDESSVPSTQKPSINISRSHSVLEQLHKRTKHDVGTGNKMMKEIMNKVFSTIQVNESNHLSQTQKDEVLLHAISDEGLFEACRLANPMLPQYHPKQLIEMLNSGKTKRVKAILLYMIKILKQRTAGGANALQRVASIRRLASMDASAVIESAEGQLQVQKSIQIGEDENMEYDELGSIPPLPLFALLEADEAVSGEEKAANINDAQKAYDSLFLENNDEDDLDEMLKDDAVSRQSRSRRFSVTSMDQSSIGKFEVSFTARHCRILTEMLTHVHLPGLSSVDQMHLLSIADTLSHFSSTAIDRLVQANVSFQVTHTSAISETTAGNYGTSATGIESVDDCGLRFLMAMKQHEYLLKCLPLKQRQSMRTKGLSTAHIIWAFHSDTEAELYNILQPKEKITWEELRSFGIAWWLKNTNTLRNCVEQMAKTAFQQRADPMDACLYYLALRKKNVLTHLFKNNNKQQMADFFKEDFAEEKWQKAALKNAFVLMSKQRFSDAAGFFLLGGSLKDALQTILRRLNDLQLAMVILRIYETDPETQSNLMCELLCSEVLGIDPSEARNISLDSPTTGNFVSPPGSKVNHDPFQRSMAYWMIKNYSKSASTLLDEANKDSFSIHGGFMGYSLSDIFNLYWFLRKHPLVIRQRLTDAGIQVGTTEKFLQLAKELESRVTPSERRLFFRTASVHMASGCPLLALDVLLRLPKQLGTFLPDDGDLAGALNETSDNSPRETVPGQSVNDFDWSAPSQIKQDELKLDWESEEEDELENGNVDVKINDVVENEPIEPKIANNTSQTDKPVDYISQHLKFVASLRVFMEELSTLASGYEVDGGQLRFELFRWLEKECVVLRDICDYQMDLSSNPIDSGDVTEIEEITELKNITLSDLSNEQPDNNEKSVRYRRAWLSAHQKLIRTFTSYCALHSGTNYRLASVLMELLLLLLELQQDKNIWCQHGDKTRPFPLLVGSLSSCRMFLSSPLHYIENQTNDILLTVAEIYEPLGFGLALPKAYELYNLCQGLSSCLYQSLTDIDNFYILENVDGVINRRYNSVSCDDLTVVSQPCRWPGVQSFISLLECEKDEDVPNLQLLLAECFVAVTMSLFCYSFSLFDSRWLFRLMAHEINAKSFGIMFGGAGEQKLRPIRPPPPNPSANQGDAIRAKLHARVFGSNHSLDVRRRENFNADGSTSCWVPPKKHIFQFYAEKVKLPEDSTEYNYDSEDVASTESVDDDDISQEEESRMHDNPESYAWHLMRLIITVQQLHRSKQFIQILGIDLKDLPSTSPKIDKVLKLLEKWIQQLIEKLDSYPGGCPENFLPNPVIEPDPTSTQNTPLLRKYRSLIEKGNTPFEYEASGVLPVRRLWSYLVRQEHLSAHFIRYIYEKQGAKEMVKDSSVVSSCIANSSNTSSPLIKIMHREQEAILAFACSNVKPSWIAVSNGREIQEMSLEALYEEQKTLADSKTSYMNNRVALDIALERTARDTFRDNDDYQVLLDGKVKNNVSFITPFILDRSRVALPKLRKRLVGGVRRMEPHPSLPYYVSGASDGSIYLWEWGLEQPLFTARSAGQYGKVTKLAFSLNGNKFAAVDGDGLLCMWQATQSLTVRKPYFNQKCHTKAAADVKFLGQTSSLLVTVGHSSGDANVSLWDTLMPSTKCIVHSFIGHADGAMCVGYLPSSQTIVSGGRHGEICFWDIRQRQLRNSFKVFDSAAIVKTLTIDTNGDYVVLGSSDGDIKIFNNDPNPVLLNYYPTEHAARGGFSLRQVGIQGVQQLFIDPGMNLLSCGADCSLKFRPLTSVVQTCG